MKDIKNQVVNANTSIDELEVYLASDGDSAQRVPSKIEYRGGEIVLEYTTKHKLKAFLVSDNFSETRIRDLVREISLALEDTGQEVSRRYLHSHYKVNGFYRYANDFQITPAPPDAPQPGFDYGHHAFVLEFSHSGSRNHFVSDHRKHKRIAELSLLLRALLLDVRLPDSSTTHAWVVSGAPNFGAHFMQLGYFGGNKYPPAGENGFSLTSGMSELPREPASKYYAQRGIRAGDSLTIPDSLERSLRAFADLPEKLKDQFYRASYWSHVSAKVFHVSRSASFIALVNGIEVFLPQPERCPACGRPTSHDHCSTCSQPKAGPVRLFREFVARHASGVPEPSLKRLYDLRSSLSHGSMLLPGDMGGIGFRHSTALNEAFFDQELLSMIARVVIVNWLHASSAK